MMHNFNWVDYVILSIFFFSILAGLARGLVKEVIALITLIASFIIATLFANPLALAFTNSQSVQAVVDQTSTAVGASTAQPVSYAAIGLSFGVLFAATFLVGSIIGSIINLAFQTGMLDITNRLLGGVFGFCRGCLINLALIFLVQITSFSTDDFWTQSKMVSAFQPAVQWLGAIVSPALADLKNKVSEKLQDSNATVDDTLKSLTN